MGDPAILKKPVSVEQFLPLIANGEPYELVHGEVVRKANPLPEHGAAQGKLLAGLDAFNRRVGGPRGPGGWWLMTEVDTVYAKTSEVFRHDAQGYRRDLHPERPTGFPCPHVPQWACEVVSPGNSRVDWIRKQRTLHAHQVPHYWLLDPREETLTVLRYHPDAYLVALTAQRGETVRAEPFGDIEIEMDELLGLT
jgi:Uma2 family endonuclease